MAKFTIRPYLHKVHYYETDKMGIAHHSNYIRWMEEARVEFLNDIGFGFAEMEKQGVISPVVSVNCHYKTPTQFDDVIEITVRMTEYNGIRFKYSYEMRNTDTGVLVATGESEHCFTSDKGKPISIKKAYPEIDKLTWDVLNNQ